MRHIGIHSWGRRNGSGRGGSSSGSGRSGSSSRVSGQFGLLPLCAGGVYQVVVVEAVRWVGGVTDVAFQLGRIRFALGHSLQDASVDGFRLLLRICTGMGRGRSRVWGITNQGLERKKEE